MRMRRFKSGWNPWTIPYVLHEVHMEFFALSVPDFAAMRHGTVAVRRVCKSWYRPGLILMLMCHALILCAATDEEIEKMIREGLQAWSSGQRAQMWARPHCEKAPWFECKEQAQTTSSNDGDLILHFALRNFTAVLRSNPFELRALLGRVHTLHALRNFSGALLALTAIAQDLSHDLDAINVRDFNGDEFGGVVNLLTKMHVSSTRGGYMTEAALVQREILRQHTILNRTFPAMHFIEIPGVTPAMALENMHRLNKLAIGLLPSASDRPPPAEMRDLFDPLVLGKRKDFTVGFVSAKGFSRYTTTTAMLGLFLVKKQHYSWKGPRGRYMRTICYAPVFADRQEDGFRKSMEESCEFVRAHDMNSVELSRRVQKDGVHVLVDLHGYSLGHSEVWAQVFQIKSAPVQVHFHGQPLTTGSELMDYYISDRVSSPPEYASHYAERLSLVHSSYLISSLAGSIWWSNGAPRDIWQPSYKQAEKTRRETYGLKDSDLVLAYFGQTYKIEAEILRTWIRILMASPRARLWLFYFPIQFVPTWEDARDNLVTFAESVGLTGARERIVMSPLFDSEVEHETKRLADLYLDTHTFNSHTTAVDAMWAGLPLVTVPGAVHNSRVAASLALYEGNQHLVARSFSDYHMLVRSLLRRPQRLQEMKRRIRTALSGNPFESSSFWDFASFSVILDVNLRLIAEVAISGRRCHVVVNSGLRRIAVTNFLA